MANVFRAINIEVASLPLANAPRGWEKLQEKLGYNDKQMLEVSSIRQDEKIAFEQFVEECFSGSILSNRAEKHARKRRAKDLAGDEDHEELMPGASTVVQKKRSKVTMRKRKHIEPSAGSLKVNGGTEQRGQVHEGGSPVGRHKQARASGVGVGPGKGKGDNLRADGKEANAPAPSPASPATNKQSLPATPQPSSTPQNAPRPEPHPADSPNLRAENGEPCRKAPGSNRSPTKSREESPFQTTNISDAAERRMSPRRPTRPDVTPASPPTSGTRNEAPATSSGQGGERWTSPRRTSRRVGETPKPSKSPRPSPERKPKKVAPKERPCPSGTVPPCPGLVPSAANKCKTCGFNIKTLRQRAQEEKREKKVSAVKDPKAIIRRITDNLIILSQKGFQTSLVWYDESTESSASLGKVGRKGESKSKEAHFLGFGELGRSWVGSDEVQKSYKRALGVYRKAKKDRGEEVKEKSLTGEQSKAKASTDGPPVTASAPSPLSYSLPQSIRSIVASLNLEETLGTKVLACLESGEVDEASLKVLIDDKDWLNPMFGDKAGPRTLFKIAVKKCAESRP